MSLREGAQGRIATVHPACDEEVLSLMKQVGSALVIMKGLAVQGWRRRAAPG